MNKKSKTLATNITDWKQFLEHVRGLILSARRTAARSVDTIQVFTNFKIGHLIVEREQGGKERADYGKRIIGRLSVGLTQEFGRGFSEDNLSRMRKFYLEYQDVMSPQISAKASRKLLPTGNLDMTLQPPKQDSLKLTKEAMLSWSHYVFLMTINDREERCFYEIEAAQNGWSLPELKRQYNSSLYERLALSRNKEKVQDLSRRGQIIETPSDMIKEPCVLEFLGLDEKAEYAESDLESAIIDKLEHFLLELGKGFLFESRQKRFTFDGDHFYVDLVFYNRLLRCYVLVDLKIGKLTHQNLGQMQMYVNYFDRHVKKTGEHPTVGIVLCRSKSSALVKMTLPKGTNIYASEYKLYLPSKAELKKKLLEWSREK